MVDEEVIFCSKCGAENNKGSDFCVSCGTPLNGAVNTQKTEIVKENTRTTEFVIGLIGAIFGFLGAFIAFLIGAFVVDALISGISAFLASIVGIIGAIYVKKNAKIAAVIMLIAGIWVFISIGFLGIIPGILLICAGVIALIR